MKSILTQSENISHEYCASVIRVGELFPIEGSDYLAKTIIDGYSVVVRKNDVHTGDIMFYAANETVLNKDFLRINNQFEINERHLNSNYEEIDKLVQEAVINDIESARCKLKYEQLLANDGAKDEIEKLQADAIKYHEAAEALMKEAKSNVGFFNKHGRVKLVTLRKCPSLGYLFTIDAMAKYCPDILNAKDELEKMADDPTSNHDFDTVNGELFIKVYIPNIPEKKQTYFEKKRQKKVGRFDRMIDGQFIPHYDTEPLNKNMYHINPDTNVTISTKIHGTSAIFAKLKVKTPYTFNTGISLLNKILNKLYIKYIPKKWQSYKVEYGNIYSSRTVIKNRYINGDVTSGYYNTDIWGEYNKIIYPYLENGMTVYGEIFGYVSGSQKTIQKNYDYGCEPGNSKLMIYRITSEVSDGKKYEWNVNEIFQWTEHLLKIHKELKKYIMPIDILYYGTLHNLYPNVDIENHWHQNILENLKNEKRFSMNQLEPLCKNKVPREGIVLRIDNDIYPEAFKLKCTTFLKEEGKLMDKGEIDMEMNLKY